MDAPRPPGPPPEPPAYAIDLHCHTNHSDGLVRPAEVVRAARQAGLVRLAITDHETMSGIPEAQSAAGSEGLVIVPGIELSAWDFVRGVKVHVLALFPPDGETRPAVPPQKRQRILEVFCRPVREQRRQGALKALELIWKAGFRITLEQVSRFPAPGAEIFKQHLLHALLEAGYGRDNPRELHRLLFHEGDDGEPPGLAHVPVRYPPAWEAVQVVQTVGGVSVLAHPTLYDSVAILPELAAAGLQALEVRHPSQDPLAQTECRHLAVRHGLAVSGGSDFHGEWDDSKHRLGAQGLLPEEYEELVGAVRVCR